MRSKEEKIKIKLTLKTLRCSLIDILRSYFKTGLIAGSLFDE
jgi:hypothetical protein